MLTNDHEAFACLDAGMLILEYFPMTHRWTTLSGYVDSNIIRGWHYDVTDLNRLFTTVSSKKILDFVKDIGRYSRLLEILICIIVVVIPYIGRARRFVVRWWCNCTFNCVEMLLKHGWRGCCYGDFYNAWNAWKIMNRFAQCTDIWKRNPKFRPSHISQSQWWNCGGITVMNFLSCHKYATQLFRKLFLTIWTRILILIIIDFTKTIDT